VFAVVRLLKIIFPPSVDLSRDLLASTSPADPLTIFTVVAVMLAVAGLASVVPARRASQVDPTVALRHE